MQPRQDNPVRKRHQLVSRESKVEALCLRRPTSCLQTSQLQGDRTVALLPERKDLPIAPPVLAEVAAPGAGRSRGEWKLAL